MDSHLHLDPVGGLAGDMFAAAMLDAAPHLGEGLVAALGAAGLAHDVGVRWEPVRDEVLAGTRFMVDDPRERRVARAHHSAILVRGHDPHHAHVPWTQIRRQLGDSGLPHGVAVRALDIFEHLARAEAAVHGFTTIDEVMFHEVGTQDAVADVVAAAWLIERCGALTWSCGALPLGSGTVNTAHGALPIPAPATARLLAGFPVHDDGRPGERVTPTGAAILKHLASDPGWRGTRRPAARLAGTGVGWGTKRIAGLPNVLRVVRLELESSAGETAHAAPLLRDEITRVAFEVDDQSAEDLAAGLEHLRAHAGVLDVLQAAAFGKKGRMVTQVRVLCAPEWEDAVVRACLLETTTLGVRVERVSRVVLRRDAFTVGDVPMKSAERPDGTLTTKAESDAIASIPGAAARRAARLQVEQP